MLKSAVKSSMNKDQEQAFSEDGYLAPVPLLTAAQCQLVANSFRSGSLVEPAVWEKGLAVHDRLIFDIATRPAIIGVLRKLMGNDVNLWGASIQHRQPHAVHPWHSDIESLGASGKFVSLWIGIENTSRASSLKLVRRSHRFGKSVQEVQIGNGFKRGEAKDTDILNWAQELDPKADLRQPDVSDGEAIVFDGRLWHGSENELADRTRLALLLQYACGDATVRMPDPKHWEAGPVRHIEKERPPVVVVSGQADVVANNVERLPERFKERAPIETFAKALPMPLERDLAGGWKPHFLLDGHTSGLQHLTCHVSVLEAGFCPHPPHSHVEEELLIVLDGQADILIAESPEDPSPRTVHFSAGDMVYHPAYQHHTLRNTSDCPVTYLMFKWASVPLEALDPLGSTVVHLSDYPSGNAQDSPFHARVMFDQPTVFLSKLHAHITDLQPDAGYAPHVDDYDVAIVLLSGTIATADQTLSAPAVVFFAENELHGMHNPGAEAARYIVFEFHGEHQAARDIVAKTTTQPERKTRPIVSRFWSSLGVKGILKPFRRRR